MLLKQIVDILFPAFCQICGSRLPCKDRYICKSCLKKIAINTPPFCRRCSRRVGWAGQLCLECLNTISRLEQVWSWGIYADVMKKFIHLFKYKKRFYLVDILKDDIYLFFDQNRIVSNIDIITAVPLHRLKLKQRTFNQSEIIARVIAKKYKTDFAELLEKKRFTKAQNQLTKIERRENIMGSFVSKDEMYSGKNILLVDDIFTTGTTMNECARILLKNGARKVYGFALARGL